MILDMKKSRKRIIIGLSIVVVIVVITGLILGAVYALLPPNVHKAENAFKNDRELLEMVISYLENSEYESINIHKSMNSGKMHVNTIILNIEDETVVKAIDTLFDKCGYDMIDKNGNTIYFQRWTRLMDFGSGIIYSINKTDKPVLQYQTKLVPLSVDGWYYCEENYNEWRSR